MNDKKHIDRLFQEKLKDFQASPSDAVWENISSKLQHQKQEKKYLPLWLRIAGIAAAILLLVAVGSTIFGNDSDPVNENTIVNTKDSNDTNTPSQDSQEAVGEGEKSDLNNNLSEDNATVETNETMSLDSGSESEPKGQIVEKDPLLINKNVNNKKTNVADNQQGNTPKLLQKQQKNAEKTEKNSVENAVANKQGENKPKNLPDPIDINQIDKSRVDELIDDKTTVNDALTDNKSENINSTVEDKVVTDEKPSLIDEIEKQDELAEEQGTNEKTDRWSIAPNVAPVYYNAFGNGSAIDGQFNSNSRSGDINISYGITANYKLNDKLSLRAGVNKLNLGYSTNNVIVYNNVDPLVINPPLRNVQLNEHGQTLSFLSVDGLGVAQVPGIVADNIKSSIDQKLGFIEVPLELQYMLSDKKVGISVIGGFSSLFLSENEIYTTLQDEETLLGEATNVRKMSFSANLGVGFDFKVSDKINLNLEPVMKYQLNTFSDTSGNFNPYTLGVQTGLRFKF